MSFETYEPARAEELSPESKSKLEGTDGTKVAQSNALTTADKQPENVDTKGSDAKKPLPSIEAMDAHQKEQKRGIESAVQKNPDWPPAKGNPEAEAALAGNLEQSLGSVL